MRPVERLITMYLAIALDILYGDPPNRYHPVAWMGRWITWLQPRTAATGSTGRRFLHGVGILLSGTLLSAFFGALLQRMAHHVPIPVRWFILALGWKTMFSLRGLLKAAAEVHDALIRHDIVQARQRVSWHLVSRDTRDLNASQVAAATIESVAENLSDSFIAPLFYGVVGGLPAAFVYRYVNTADAMMGYRSPEYEWLGKAPARADDALNLLPARLSALLIVAAAALTRADARCAWHIMRRDARRTASPNAGYPMSAMAGALRVELEKRSHYRLGTGPSPQANDIPRALQVVRVAATLGTCLFSVILGLSWLASREGSGEEP